MSSNSNTYGGNSMFYHYYDMLYQKLHEMFGFDRRSIALFRICVAAVVIGDLIQRSCDLKAHYTDAGILPRSYVLEKYSSPYYFPVHMINGSTYYQAFIFILHGLFAFSMMIGYYSRFCTFVTWFLLLSLQEHNPIVGHAGDVYFRLMLFFGMFLPLGSCYAVDCAYFEDGNSIVHSKKVYGPDRKWWHLPSPVLTPHYRYLSMGTVAILTQMALMYVISWYHKTGDEWRVTFTATWYALQLDYFATPLGRFLLNFPETLKFLTWAVAYWEKFGPLFYCIPWKTDYFRLFAGIGFMFLHIGFGSSLRLGTFMWITILAQTVVLPTWMWEVIFYKLRTRERLNLKIYFNPSSSFSEYLALTLKTFFLIPETRCAVISESNQEELEKGEYLPTQTPYTPPFEVTAKEPIPHESTIISFSQFAREALISSGSSNTEWFVVVDVQGHKTTNLRALSVALSHSPLLWWLPALISKIPFKSLTTFGVEFFKFLHNLTKYHAGSHTNGNAPLHVRRRMSPRHRPLVPVGSIFSNVFLGFLVVFITSWNLSNIGSQNHLPYSMNWIGVLLRIDQSWNMFSPHPPKSHWWYVFEGHLDDGTQVELFKNEGLWNWEGIQPFNFDKPDPFYKSFGNHRWYKFFENGYNGRDAESLRLNFGRYLCREYNGRHSGSKMLHTFTIHFVIEHQNPDGTRTPYNHSPLWNHICYEKPTRP